MIEGSTVKKSLLTELTTLGVDDWLFVINVELFLVMAVMFKMYLWVIVTAVLHVALMVVTQVQPRVLQVYFKFARQRVRYSSWCITQPARGAKRPAAWLALNGAGL